MFLSHDICPFRVVLCQNDPYSVKRMRLTLSVAPLRVTLMALNLI